MLTKFDIERFIVLSPPCVKVGRELLAIAPYCDFCLTHIYLDLSVFLGLQLSHGCSEAKIGTKYAEKYCPGFSDEIWNFREGGGRLAMTRKGEGGGGVHRFQR